MVFAFDVLRSERIFWKRSVRRDLLWVEMRIGKRACRSLRLSIVSVIGPMYCGGDYTDVGESMMSFLRSSTRLPTTFSRNSGSSSSWCVLSMFIRSCGN